MFNKFLYSILFFVIVNYSHAQIKSQNPNWVDAKYREAFYAQNIYLRGFSTASLLADETLDNLLNRLSNAARREMLESIQVKVKSTSVLNTTEATNKISSNYNVTTESNSQFDIATVKIEKYFDATTKVGYAFAYSKRADIIDFYANLIALKKSEVEAKIQEAQLYEQSQSLQSALKSYAKTIELFNATVPLQQLLIALGNNEETVIQSKALDILEISAKQKITDIIKKESFFVDAINTNVSGRYKEPLFNPLEAKVFLTTGANKKLTANIPLKFFQDTTTFCEVVSNKIGESKCEVSKVISKDKSQAILVTLDIAKYLNISKENAEEEVFANLSNVEKFNVNIINLRFFITSEEDENGILSKNPVLAPQVKKFVSNLGFAIASKPELADYTIYLKTNTVQAGASNFKTLQFVSVFVNCTLSISDVKKQEEIFSNNYTNMKGISNSTSKAFNLAYKKSFDNIKKDLEILYKDKAIK